jgi:ribosomal protein S12 methylthiotransferase
MIANVTTSAELLARAPSVSFVTLGCAKNEVDSNRMRALVRAAGLEELEDPEAADVVVVNTCSFITEATQEAIDTIFSVLALKNFTQGSAKLIVAGCMPARYGSSQEGELARELPEVALFLAPGDEDGIVEAVLGLAGAEDGLEFAPQGEAMPQAGWKPASREPQGVCTRIADGPSVYVKIADGCSRRCAFCTIPQIRGPYVSRPAADIILETGELVAQGVREIVLIAQDTGIWREPGVAAAAQAVASGSGEAGLLPVETGGSPVRPYTSSSSSSGAGLLPGEPGASPSTPRDLPELLDALAASHPDTWFRLMYLQPQGVSDKLLNVMAKHANICDYLDIPLQHADAAVLKEMNRTGCGEDYLQMIERIRSILPNASLRTTMIAGFPGESRRQAASSERFLEQAGFAYVGVFTYSQEDGTPAGERSDQVPVRTRRARAQRLRDIADQAGAQAALAMVGTVQEVLVCGEDEEGAFGRTQAMAPDVDGIVHILGVSLCEKSPIRHPEFAEVLSLPYGKAQDQDLTQQARSSVPDPAVTNPGALPQADVPVAAGERVNVLITEAVLYDLYGEVV